MEDQVEVRQLLELERKNSVEERQPQSAESLNEEHFDFDDSTSSDDEPEPQVTIEKMADFRNFWCHTVMDIAVKIQELAEMTAVVTQLPQSVCRGLLYKYKWDRNILLLDYGSMSFTKFFEKNNLGPLASALIASSSILVEIEVEQDEGNLVECPVCLDVIPREDSANSECGHKICLKCWTGYLRQEVEKNGSGLMIECPACPYIISDSLVKELIPDPIFHNKLQSSQVNSFVESNPWATWCPWKKCSEVIVIVESKSWGPGPVICNLCDFEFCFACGREWHAPLYCEFVEVWQKMVNDSNHQSVDWIRLNSKPCPRCGVRIQKNGGCNNVTCSHNQCGHRFCWICLGPSHHYQGENCTNRNPNPLRGMQEDTDEERKRLEDLAFHTDRYFAHMKSLELEAKLPEVTGKIVEETHSAYGIFIVNFDKQGIKNSVRTLHRCRRMLAYGYASSYFLVDDPGPGVKAAELFTENLNDLHLHTEKLSLLLEQELQISANTSAAQFERTRIEVLNKAHYCNERRLKLVSHVMENYEQGLWKLADRLSF